MSRRSWAVFSAVVVAALGVVAAVLGCAKPEGVRIEGSAPTSASTLAAVPPVPTVPAPEPRPDGAGQSPSPGEGGAVEADPPGAVGPESASTMSAFPSVDVVELLRSDPSVKVKNELRSCRGDAGSYPLEATYASLTTERGTDLVVNVSTCADGVGVGAYVYRKVGGAYVNVFAAENPPVWAQTADGTLEVAQQTYGDDDPVFDPSGETITTYRWNGHFFEQIAKSAYDYRE